jgi:hypothetical protein
MIKRVGYLGVFEPMTPTDFFPATHENSQRIYRSGAGLLVFFVLLMSFLVVESIITPTVGTLLLTIPLGGGALIGFAAANR